MSFFYCSDSENIEGPVPLETLQKFLTDGLVSKNVLVCSEGSSNWAPLATLTESSATSKVKPHRRSKQSQISNPEYEVILRDVPFTRRQRANRSLHILQGMLLGFSLDKTISPEEISELKAWAADHHQLFSKHPFNEIVPKINFAIQHGKLGNNDRDDLIWLCQQLSDQAPYYEATTADMQRLHGILHGALADGRLSDEEIEGLNVWLKENNELENSFPYDELVSILTSALADGRVDEGERKTLVSFFEGFVAYSSTKRADKVFQSGLPPRRLSGICAHDPSIVFEGKSFCFTGASAVAPRKQIAVIVAELGGTFSNAVTKAIDYLIVGQAGNPAWAYACYGRKVEQAMNLRSEGCRLLLVNERDFWPKAESVRGAPVLP